eukprot:jgi/Tetstr1/428917/TSEL_018893.t1
MISSTITVALLACIWLVPRWYPLLALLWGALMWLRLKVVETNALHEHRMAVDAREHTVLQRQLYYNPATSVETPETINKILMAIWPSFLERKITKKIGEKIAKKIRDSAPPNMEVTVESLTLGSAAPYLSSWQAFSDSEGALTHWDLSVKFVSSQLAIAISARVETATVAVNTTITVHGVSVSGNLRFFPFLEDGLILYGFKEKPTTKLQIRVKGPGGVEAELGGFSFLEKAFSTVMEKKFTLPNRKAIGLDINDLFADVVGAQVSVHVVAVSGVPAQLLTSGAGEDALEMEVKLQQITRMLSGKLEGSGSAAFHQKLYLQLAGMDGQLFFKVFVNKKSIGTASLLLDHMADGTTAWWGQLEGGLPFAKRQRAKGSPWKVTIPLEEKPEVQVSVEVRVREWHYHKGEAAEKAAAVQGGHALLLQIVEARQLTAVHRGEHSDPYVRIKYGEQELNTAYIDRTLTPFWNEVIILDENLYSTKLALEVRDHNDSSADRAIGRTTLKTASLTEEVTESWLQLTGVDTGELLVRAVRLPGSSADPAVVSEGTKLRQLDTTLEVTVGRGIDLISCDRLGSSDPFVVLHYGQTRHKTQIKKNTLNPTWRELKFMRYQEGLDLKLEVFDWDRVGSPDFMGTAMLSAAELSRAAGGEETPVTLKLSDVKSGSLELSFKRVAGAPKGRTRLSVTDDCGGLSPMPSDTSSPMMRHRLSMKKRWDGGSAMPIQPLSPQQAIGSATLEPGSRSMSPFSALATTIYSSTTSILAPLINLGSNASDAPPSGPLLHSASVPVSGEGCESELKEQVAAQELELEALKARHAKTIARMKRDQGALLAKVSELEAALAEL